MVLGEQLLSLGEDCQLLVWRIGKYDEPEVRCATLLPSHHARDHHLLTQQAACLPVRFLHVNARAESSTGAAVYHVECLSPDEQKLPLSGHLSNPYVN